MSDKQLQKAGDNSKQIQTGDIYISNGISEQRVREICSEIAGKAIADNSREAIDIAMKRIDFFTDLLLPRMQSIEKAFDSFSDPSFQVLLMLSELTDGKNNSDLKCQGAPDKTLPDPGKVLFLYHGRNLNFDSSLHIRDLMREKGVTNIYTSEIWRKIIL